MAPVPRLYHRQRQLKIIIRRIRAKDGEARGGRNSADRLKAVGFKGKPVAADWNTARFRTCTHVPVLRVARPTFRSLANDRVAFLKLKPFRPPPFCLSIFVCLSVCLSFFDQPRLRCFLCDRPTSLTNFSLLCKKDRISRRSFCYQTLDNQIRRVVLRWWLTVYCLGLRGLWSF